MALNHPQHPLLIDTVMVNVLSYLPQKDFLSARLVCPIWDVNGRHLIKNNKGGFDFCINMIDQKAQDFRFSQFNSIFEDDPDGKKMVYSKFEFPDAIFCSEVAGLQIETNGIIISQQSIERFFQKYGDKIKSVKLLLSHEPCEAKDCKYKNNLENAAKLMPNLEAIQFGNYKNKPRIISLGGPLEGTSESPAEQSPRIIRTPKFNNVTRMKIRGEEIPFKLKNIPKYFPNIHHLSIANQKKKVESILEKSFDYWTNPAPIQCHIEALTIENIYNSDLVVLKRLAKECGLKLKYFNGTLNWVGLGPFVDIFRNLYEFIIWQKKSLERLDFKITKEIMKKSYPFNWPSSSVVFPKLTSLGIRGEFIHEICKGREFHKVFPSVEKIQLELPFIRKFQRNSNFGDLFPSLTPSKVKVLEITLNREISLQDEFRNIPQYFPNIQELSLIIKSYSWGFYLSTLFQMDDWMEKIKILKISILRNDEIPIQIDRNLLDLSETDYIMRFVKFVGSDLEEAEKDKPKELLGIAQFKNLIRLELSGRFTLIDISAYLGFGQMNSLKQILLTSPGKADLTPKCEEFLRRKGIQILTTQGSPITNVPDDIVYISDSDSSEEDDDEVEGLDELELLQNPNEQDWEEEFADEPEMDEDDDEWNDNDEWADEWPDDGEF